MRTLEPMVRVLAEDHARPDRAVVADDGRARHLGRGVELEPLPSHTPGRSGEARRCSTWTLSSRMSWWARR